MRRVLRGSALAAAAGLAVSLAVTVGGAGSGSAAAPVLRDVVLVGNSVSGTVSFLDGRTGANLGSIKVAADANTVINGMNPVERIGYETVKAAEKGIRYVDDVFASKDGRTLFVSRGELQDVVAIDIASRRQVWRTKIEGFKTDHAVLSRDGSQFIVSATTAQKVFVLSTATGAVVTSFPTGTYPHAVDYSPDGKYLYNSSIGITSLPSVLNGLKGQKTITVVDPTSYKVLRTYSFDYGVRPAVFTADNRYAYLQLSYYNGFVEFDLTKGKITRKVPMPFSAAGKALALDDYPQNSAHHGLALSAGDAKLCDLGTIDDYAAILSRPGLTVDSTVHYPTGAIPYWATTSVDGAHCLVSLSGLNAVSVIDYGTGKEVARIPVGSFPQRERLGKVRSDVLTTLDAARG